MADNLIEEALLARAVSNIVPRSERQPDLAQLRQTYVETGVLPQVMNFSNQILYGRRGTGKTHVLQVLGGDMERAASSEVIYMDVRLLGSAHLFQDESRHPADRCVAVFKDLLSILQARLLDVATDPGRDGSGIQEVSEFADFVLRKTIEVATREVKEIQQQGTERGVDAELRASLTNVGVDLKAGDRQTISNATEVGYTEALRETVVFSEVYQMMDRALNALGIEHFVLLIDEWTSLPVDMQPFIAEFLKGSFFPSLRVSRDVGDTGLMNAEVPCL